MHTVTMSFGKITEVYVGVIDLTHLTDYFLTVKPLGRQDKSYIF
jgi:hypothetical protein